MALESQRVVTDDPVRAQWQLISRFTYPANVHRYRADHDLPEVGQAVGEYISGCFRQASAYYASASVAPLDISPLLLYYGTTNLLAGACALVEGSKPLIRNHGMRLIPPDTFHGIGEYTVLPLNPTDGALQVFANTFAEGRHFTNGSTWRLSELLGSVPDLRRDFLLSYPEGHAYTIPVEEVRTPDLTFDRFPREELQYLPQDGAHLPEIAGYTAAYLPPHMTKDFVILFRKPHRAEIGCRSIAGEKYLELPHEKSGQWLQPSQLMAMFMALYAVATLSRYSPEMWHPFVRTDATGERHVIEHLISTGERYIPNLVLNRIEGREIQFRFSLYSPTDAPVPMSRAEVEQVAEESVKNVLRRGNVDV